MASSRNKNANIMRISFLAIFVFQTTSFGIVFSVNYNAPAAPLGLLPFAQKHVVIVNKLASKETLVTHCLNKGDDKGIIFLGPDQSFGFKFRVNLRKTTTYTCSFAWPNVVETFDIFTVVRDDNPKGKYGVCSECIWYIYEFEACRIRRDGGPYNCFQFKPKLN